MDPDPNRVNSKESFLEFIEDLRADWEASQEAERKNPSPPYGPKARYWENPELGSFLEAMHAWVEDMGDRLPSDADWETFARMFIAGKGYE